MNEYVPDTWQSHNIDAGTLKSAALAVFLVVSVSVGSTLGFLSWLDAVIRSHVDPVESAVGDLQDEVSAYRRETRALRNEVQAVQRKIELIKRRQSRRDDQIIDRLDSIAEGDEQ